MVETAAATPSTRPLERYEAVIGIEVHCQLRTASKMFCSCSTAYDGAPPEHPRLPGLPRPARARCRSSTGAAVEHVLTDRPGHRGDDARRDPLGSQELLLPGPAQGLPDQPVRPAAGVGRPAGHRDLGRAGDHRHHPGAPRGGHGQARPRHGLPTAGGSASSTSTGPVRRSWRSSPTPTSARPSRAAATPRSCSCCCARSAHPMPTWSAARCGSRPTCRCGRAAPSRSGRGSRSRT